MHTGAVGNADVVATTTGIGTALATSATERLLGLGDFDRVMVVGIAGGVGPSVGIGDLVIPEVVVDGTSGKRVPARADRRSGARGARSSPPTTSSSIPTGSAQLIAQGVIAVDMETGSVAAVCADRGVPWSAVRAISDRAEDGDEEMVKLANPDGSPERRGDRALLRPASRPDPLHAQGREGRDARGEERGHDRRPRVRAVVDRTDIAPDERRTAEPAIDLRLHPGVLACILVGGALGSLARYGVGRVVHVPTDGFPRATFVINLSGRVRARLLSCRSCTSGDWPARYVRPLFAVGFCGAFTTFSTMAVETVTLVKDHHAGLGVGYLLVSIALGLITCTLGVRLGRLVARSSAIRRA